MFKIKICGIADPDEEVMASNYGADAVGLNFVPSSPRCLPSSARAAFTVPPPPKVLRIGVFVNESAEVVLGACHDYHLAAVQLHGEEPAEVIDNISGVAIIKAFRASSANLDAAQSYCENCARRGRQLAAVLIDSDHGGSRGGSGVLANWDVVKEFVVRLGGLPIILAGGLGPANVCHAIRVTGVAGVDVASGVESVAGRKDPTKVKRFVLEAVRAWET